ncbi:MAG: SoxR reducing system RseC family protein [Candidatus Eisenbacteria bacterium]|nr:SoxR reducing system RseC family protein [Candidatus Eisenbacteria bacterium]
MREIGRVVSVQGDAAVVAMPGTGSCDRCGLCLMGQDGKQFLLLARNAAGAAAGDAVEVEIAEGRVIAAAFAVYMVPVLATIIGFAVGNAIAGGAPDAALPIVLAVACLAVSFVAVWAYDLRLRKAEKRQVVITRIVSAEEAEREGKHVRPVRLGG